MPGAQELLEGRKKPQKTKYIFFQFESCRARNLLLSRADEELENPEMSYIVIKKEADADTGFKSYNIIFLGGES